jgi:hypothetical protein
VSRKRKDKPVSDAVPSEILAEGSGPNEVVDANPQSLVAAAQDLVDKRNMPAESPADLDAAPSADEEPAPKRRKRGKHSAVAAEPDVPGADEVLSDPAELAATDIALAEIEAAHAGDDDAMLASEAAELELERERENDAFDAAADNVAPESLDEQAADIVATAEGAAVAAVEDAVMRAEAEAELGAAEADIAGEGDVELELGATLPTTAASMDASSKLSSSRQISRSRCSAYAS